MQLKPMINQVPKFSLETGSKSVFSRIGLLPQDGNTYAPRLSKMEEGRLEPQCECCWVDTLPARFAARGAFTAPYSA